ncbi:MAG TPA: acyl-CoA thioesterase [Thermoanaerobaculia bacterium]
MSAVRDRPPLVGATLDIAVRFAECDPYGVVWHGHYALYLEEVRDRLTARFGFTPAKALALGYRVPVTRLEIQYRAPARPDGLVRATARLRPPDTARFVLDYELRGESGDLLARAETEQVVVNADGELLLTLPAALKRLVAEIIAFQDSGPSL